MRAPIHKQSASRMLASIGQNHRQVARGGDAVVVDRAAEILPRMVLIKNICMTRQRWITMLAGCTSGGGKCVCVAAAGIASGWAPHSPRAAGASEKARKQQPCGPRMKARGGANACMCGETSKQVFSGRRCENTCRCHARLYRVWDSDGRATKLHGTERSSCGRVRVCR